MTGVSGIAQPSAQPADAEGRLRHTARQLEGVFVEQLMKAMRQTVSHDGYLDGGTGEEMFTGMLDQHTAEAVPAEWKHGLSDAVVRQLRHALPGSTDATPATTISTSKGTAR